MVFDDEFCWMDGQKKTQISSRLVFHHSAANRFAISIHLIDPLLVGKSPSMSEWSGGLTTQEMESSAVDDDDLPVKWKYKISSWFWSLKDFNFIITWSLLLFFASGGKGNYHYNPLILRHSTLLEETNDHVLEMHFSCSMTTLDWNGRGDTDAYGI